MNDEWRLQVDLHDPQHAQPLLERLDARELQHELSSAFQDRIVVSRDDARIFRDAGSWEQIEGARELLLKLAEQHGWSADVELRRWHPAAEEWEDPDKPLPDGEGAKQAEREELMAAERRHSEESGDPEYEVRVDLPSRHDAVDFAKRLRSENLPAVHRWRFLLVGATDEDSAKALAERIRSEAPAGSRVTVEGTWKEAYAEQPPNPFAVLGGLGV
jgi:hypothetical protein